MVCLSQFLSFVTSFLSFDFRNPFFFISGSEMFHVKICSTDFAVMLKDKSFSLCFMKAEVVHGRILPFFPSTCADTQPFLC